MSELFDEVDEEVRREQLKKLWDRYSIYIVAAAILVVAAVGGWRMARYNIEMGPPMLAPMLMGMVGGMGMVAAVLRREGSA